MTFYEKNLKFLSYGSDPIIIPKEMSFLNKYFKTKVQRTFLKYYFVFKDKSNFCDHTGFTATTSFICKMTGKYHYLVNEFENARKNMDLEKIGKIQMAKFKVLKKFY
jgi:hypothetical protein